MKKKWSATPKLDKALEGLRATINLKYGAWYCFALKIGESRYLLIDTYYTKICLN